jgi:hypothetical protein
MTTQHTPTLAETLRRQAAQMTTRDFVIMYQPDHAALVEALTKADAEFERLGYDPENSTRFAIRAALTAAKASA